MIDFIECQACNKATLETTWAEEVQPINNSRFTWESTAMYYELTCPECGNVEWTQTCITGANITEETKKLAHVCSKSCENEVSRVASKLSTFKGKVPRRHFSQEQIDEFHSDK